LKSLYFAAEILILVIMKEGLTLEAKEKKDKLSEFEKKKPLSLAGLAISCLICSYLLAFNRDFLIIERIAQRVNFDWITKGIIILMLIMAITFFRHTIKSYFNENKPLMKISSGLLLLPANAMWFILWPNAFFRISLGFVLFTGIYLFSSGFLQLIRETYINDKEKNKTIKISFTLIAEVIAVVLTIFQFIILFN